MTELNEKNRKLYLDVCKRVWDLDDESMKYIEKRTSDEWEPVPELKTLIGCEGSTYEDQRIRFDLDMANTTVQSFFEENDSSFEMFKNTFGHVISYLRNEYNATVGYKEFIENKMTFKKNVTKIKKVFEMMYAEDHRTYERDSGDSYDKDDCAAWIVKKFERIGASKKSAKKLQLVISFNPMDWLMASTSEDWSSCFNINNEAGGYQYCLGLPFLCGDKNRMLLYITDGSQKECMGIKVDHYQTRTWCILDTSNTMNIVKWYPNDTVGVNPVSSITKNDKFRNRDNFQKGKYPLDIISTKKGAVIGVYSDMGRLTAEDGKLWLKGNGKDGQQVFTKNLMDCSQISSRHSIRIGNGFTDARVMGLSCSGYRIPQWKKLGLNVDAMFPTLTCKSCGEDKTGIVLRNDNGFLCYDCYKDKVFTCGSCGAEGYISDKIVEVLTSDGKKIRLCETCAERIKERTCDCCGKYSTRSLINTQEGEKICSSCLEVGANGYGRCDYCSKITKNIKVVYNTYSKDRKCSCSECTTRDGMTVSTFGRYFTIKVGKKGAVSE